MPALNELPKSLILCGPDYGDGATEILGRCLEEITVAEGIKVFYEIGKDVTRERIIQNLNETKGYNRIKIFVGHGATNALLGPVYDGCLKEVIEGKEFSKLYDDQLVNREISSLFAFCCNSSQILGPLFTSHPGRTYLGYSVNIGYDLSNDECTNIWKQIILLISEEIVRDGTITDRHENSLRQLYTDAIAYFMSGKGENNDSRLNMLIGLIRHRQYLQRYGG